MAVVGGGIVGVTAAYELAKRGSRVVLLERDRIVRGVTGHTTAKLTSQHGTLYHRLADRFGEDKARIHADANQAAIGWVRDTLQRIGVDAAYTPAAAYVYATAKDDVETLRQEARVARALGLPASSVDETELPFPVRTALRFDDQAHFHPRRHVLGLAEAFEAAGGTIHEHSAVTKVQGGRPAVVHTANGKVTARSVIVATNVPINDNLYFVTRLKPRRSYGIAVPSDFPLEGMYINAGEPVRSVRPYHGPDGPMLVFVGDNHPVGHGTDTDVHHQRLTALAREHFGVKQVAYRWSTQDHYPSDDLPYVGRMSAGKGHVWTATGLQGWGMSMGTAAALMLADAVTDVDNDWLPLYDPFAPGRVMRDLVRPELMKTQAHVARMFVSARVQPHEAHALEPGEGAIIETDGDRLAVHRDRAGTLHACAAKCTHMGCIVNWNHGEQSWDCGCHGSRFSGTGEVLHGPATKDLAPRDVPARLARETSARRS